MIHGHDVVEIARPRAGFKSKENDSPGRTFLNPTVQHASTIIFPNSRELHHATETWPYKDMSYGRYGGPTHRALEKTFAKMENAHDACITTSGVSAINVALLAFLSSGDHALVIDGAYAMTKTFCETHLKRFGIRTSFFNPNCSPKELGDMMEQNTRVVFIESPTSNSFEVADVVGLAKLATSRGAKVIMDNTWGLSLFHPLDHGCDIVVASLTKYANGGSDVMMGALAARSSETFATLREMACSLAILPGPDDVYTVWKGLQTISVRMKCHYKSGMQIAKWLQGRKEVARVMHPSLSGHANNARFMKLYSSANGLFGFQLREGYSDAAVEKMVDRMECFSIGLSWGGYESLLILTDVNAGRSSALWKYGDGFGQTLRIHVGLDDPLDLIRDLKIGFEKLADEQAQCESYIEP